MATRLRPCALGAWLLLTAPAWIDAAELRSTVAGPTSGSVRSSFDGIVEAQHSAWIAAQVSGAVVQLGVKVGDRVAAGQLLLRMDARAADQSAGASEAQVQAARALLEVASQEFERQKQLFASGFISMAALERAEAGFKATQAQVTAQVAQASAAKTQSGFYTVRAPFDGVVAELPVSVGDMAMPGRPLVLLYDPAHLRVTVALPENVASRMPAGQLPRIELPGLANAGPWAVPLRMQLLPTVDPATHTVQLRADLPPGQVAWTPGMFARLWLTLPASATARADAPWSAPLTSPLSVSSASIVRRAEMTGLYVLDGSAKPVLRQVRLGRTEGDKVEVLSGLMPGERVVADPQTAARSR